jgi:hypothetical protein
MSVKLSSFLNTSFATSAIDSIAVIGIIEAAEATMPLDSGTSGNYLKNLLVDSSLSITGTSAHAATPTIGIDSSFTATLSTAQTLTNKTINFSNNTINMTLSQLNTAISGGISVASLTGTEILTNKTLTAPIINTPSIIQGSITDITTFGLRDITTSTFETRIVSNNASSVLTADRTLTLDINNANRTLSLTGNLSTVGGNNLTLTTTGSTSVTVPTTGTLVSKDGSGNVSIAGTMTAAAFSGDGSGLTGVTSYVKSNFDSDFGTKTTDDLTEGSTNLYYDSATTETNARNAISVTGDLSYVPSTGVMSFSETYSTASELLTAIKTVDGAASGLDADTLDGQQGTYYRVNVYNNAGTLLN